MRKRLRKKIKKRDLLNSSPKSKRSLRSLVADGPVEDDDLYYVVTKMWARVVDGKVVEKWP